VVFFSGELAVDEAVPEDSEEDVADGAASVFFEELSLLSGFELLA
jgi:hypothetical protein